MRKSIIFIGTFLSIITSHIRAEPYNMGCGDGEECARFIVHYYDKHQEYLVGRKQRYISLIATRQAVLDLKNNYTPTSASDFLPMTSFIYDKSGMTSPFDILTYCLEYYSYQEYMIYDCLRFEKGKCVKRGLPYMLTCFAFLDKVLQFHNDAVSKNIVPNTGMAAGTYVKRTKASDVFKVINVIVSGQNNGPAPVWLIDDNDSDTPKHLMYQNKPLFTHTADMFLDKPSGVPVGAFDNNYIILRDVTSMVIDSYRRGIGTDSYTMKHGTDLLPNGTEDLKRNKDFNMVEYIESVTGELQEKTDPHTNGILFEGQVVTAEWLGHYLYGMVRQESALDNKDVDCIRDELQRIDNGGADGQSDSEAPQFQSAADEGSEFVQFLSHFSGSSFASPRDATRALVEFLQKQHRWQNIICKMPEKTSVLINSMMPYGSMSAGGVYMYPEMRDIYTIKCTLDNIEYTFGIGQISGM